MKTASLSITLTIRMSNCTLYIANKIAIVQRSISTWTQFLEDGVCVRVSHTRFKTDVEAM